MKKASINNWRIFSFIYGFSRPHWPLVVFGTLLYCSQTVLMPLVNMVLMSGVTAAITQKDISLLPKTALGSFGLLAVSFVLVSVGILLYVQGDLRTTRLLQKKLFRAFVSLDAESRAHSGDLLSSINTDVASASYIYSDALSNVVNCLLPIVILSVTLFAMNAYIGLLTVAAGLVSLLGQYVFAKPLAKVAGKSLETVAEATRMIGDFFSGGLIVRAFGMEKFLLGDFARTNTALRRLSRREATMNAGQKLFSGLSQLMTLGGVFVLGSILISRGQLNMIALMAMISLCESVSQSIGQIGAALAGMQAPIAAGRRIYGILDGDNRVGALPAPVGHPSGRYDIAAENLTFAYQGADVPVFHDLSLSIPENTYVAIAGKSGCGKSTLLKVLAGLYTREDIGISIGGKRMSAANPDEWRSYFSYVDQSCTLFDLSVAENIALGKANATFEEVQAAAKEAGADAFIRELPQDYDTPVGQTGASLSGGQRQRIAIARALIRRSPILVFDEPTSALDKQTETEVLTAIEALRGNYTILMVTHNMDAIQPDRIVWL